MLKYINKIILVSGVIMYSLGIMAQTQETTPVNSRFIKEPDIRFSGMDFTYIQESDIRLSGYNASGLRYLPVDKISIAEVFANKSDGKFVNYYQSNNSYNMGAIAESFYRLNPRIVFYGKVSYDYFKGKNMNGSVFIDPYYNPFDIVEYETNNRGDKNLETYSLLGAVSADLTERFSVGGKMDYKAANYSKHKDLRHVNKLLDMNFTAGMNYRFVPQIELGVNYYYRRSTEGLQLSTYGPSDILYNYLIDYGAFFGNTELFGEGRYVRSGNETPMVNEFNGVSIQMNLDVTSNLQLFSEVTYKSRQGYYGTKGARTVVYSKHNSAIWESKLMASFRKRNNLYWLKISVDNEELENFESVYVTQTEGGGINYIEYYDPLKTADKSQFNGSLEYAANLGVLNLNPIWAIKARFDYQERKQTASVYPFYRKQTIRNYNFGLSGKHNIIRDINMYSITLGASWLTGSGDPLIDSTYATPSEDRNPPKNMNMVLNKEYEYLTATQFKADIVLGYSRLFPKWGLRGYTNLAYSIKKASDIKYLDGSSFQTISLVVGCAF